MPLPSDRAKTLKEAFRVCDVRPLQGADIERYYVDLSAVRSTEAIAGVSSRLDFLEPGECTTILFTGHRGCGKSTELRRIQANWETAYRVIYLEADKELDVNDAQYTDIYLVIIKRVAEELRKLGLKFDPKLLSSFEAWFKDVTQETEETVEKSIALEAGVEAGLEVPFLSKLLTKLLAQIRGSNKQRTLIRKTLEQDISRLKTDINLLLGNAQRQLLLYAQAMRQIKPDFPKYKGFLILFDNLDRVPPEVGRHLFIHYASQLQDLDCTIIYTAPISVVYAEQSLSNSFGSPNTIPMINIYGGNRALCNLDYNPVGLAAVVEIIEQRVEVEQIFESREQLLELVKASGGHVRQLMQLMNIACVTAHSRKHAKILPEDVLYATKQVQFDFERAVPSKHYPILAKVCLTKQVERDEVGQLMLFNTSVLEYNGLDRWNYINPLVMRSHAFQQALQTLQQDPQTT